MSHTKHSWLVAGVAVLAGLATTIVPDAVAAAAAGPTGARRSPAAPARRAPATLSIVGHGLGPGIGMGQWGDFGYAVRYHFVYERILDHFYGGTLPATAASVAGSANPALRVLILENMNLSNNVGYDTVVTSPSAFTLSSSAGAPPATTLPPVPGSTGSTGSSLLAPSGATGGLNNSGSAAGAGASGATGLSGVAAPSGVSEPAGPTAPVGATSFAPGTALDLALQRDGTFSAYVGASCSSARRMVDQSAPVLTGLLNPVISPASSDPGAPVSELLTLCRHDGVDEPLRGSIEAYDREGYARTINIVPLESYLDGVVPAEESASWGLVGTSTGAPLGQPWGLQALMAQAVAARSYALAYARAGGWNGYADICDSTLCQAYVGAAYEAAPSNRAVAATTGEVRVFANNPGAVVLARYSASTGGFTASSSFPAVADLGDACLSRSGVLPCNPVHTWRLKVRRAAISRAYKHIGALVAVRVLSRNGYGAFGGRALKVAVIGRRATDIVSASSFVAALSLPSDWFAFVTARAPAPVAQHASGPSGLTGTTGPISSGASGLGGASGATGSSTTGLSASGASGASS